MNKPSILPKGLAGHVVDLVRVARFRFQNPHSYTKLRAINALRRDSGAKTFIETGTYRGITAKRCARSFERVFTIELDEKLAAEAAHYLRRCVNVRVIQGDGLVEVKKLMADPGVKDVLLFLDGHFSGGVTALGDMEEPAVEELAILAQYRHKICGILIDDFRMFGSGEWPAKWEIIRTAETLFANHGFRLAVHLDQIVLTRLNRER